jgi:hypothetical protein
MNPTPTDLAAARVEEVARIVDPEAFKTAEEWSCLIKVGALRDYGDGKGAHPYTQQDSVRYGVNRHGAFSTRRREARAKAKAILDGQEGRLRTLIESALSSEMTLWARNRLLEALAILPPPPPEQDQ